jgi:hypothetical protein
VNCFVVVQEWVPIMEADVQRQKTQRQQAPFSDAYMQGMPPKRRRVRIQTFSLVVTHVV